MKKYVSKEPKKVNPVLLGYGDVEGIGHYNIYKTVENNKVRYYVVIEKLFPRPEKDLSFEEMNEILNNKEIAEQKIRKLWENWLTVFYDD